MPNQKQIDLVTGSIGWLQSMGYDREGKQIPAPVSDASFPWWESLSRAEQASVLDAYVNWDGFSKTQQQDVTRRVLDGEELDAWMVGIPASDRPIRPLTQHLIECCHLDVWPSPATVTDFGIDTSNHLGALQFAIRQELVTPQELDAAMGRGKALTEIAQRGENPYRFVAFNTAWDVMRGEPDAAARAAGEHKSPPTPSQIVDAPRDYLQKEQQQGHSNDQDHGHEQ